jgi:hypothetical protein
VDKFRLCIRHIGATILPVRFGSGRKSQPFGEEHQTHTVPQRAHSSRQQEAGVPEAEGTRSGAWRERDRDRHADETVNGGQTVRPIRQKGGSNPPGAGKPG